MDGGTQTGSLAQDFCAARTISNALVDWFSDACLVRLLKHELMFILRARYTKIETGGGVYALRWVSAYILVDVITRFGTLRDAFQ